eukprot:2190145-Amphidinium_carterae.1
MLARSISPHRPGSAWAWVLSQGPKGERLISIRCEEHSFPSASKWSKCTCLALAARWEEDDLLRLPDCSPCTWAAGQPGTQKCWVCPCRAECVAGAGQPGTLSSLLRCIKVHTKGVHLHGLPLSGGSSTPSAGAAASSAAAPA